MRLFVPATAGCSLLLIAAPALAQDQAPAEPAPFSGLYVAAAGGYDVQPNDIGSSLLFDRNLDGRFGDTVRTAAGANAFSPGFCNGATATATNTGCRNDRDGWNYYGRIGVDQQHGHVVVGFLGEFGRTEINDSTTGFSTTPASYVFTRSIDWEASIRGRVGIAPGPAATTLFYATGGPGYARIDRSFTTTNTANAFALRGKRGQLGINAGGGIEQKIGRHVSFGLEYMYHQYRDDDARVRVTQGSAPATNPFVLAPNTSGTDLARSDTQFRWHSMRGTLAYRF